MTPARDKILDLDQLLAQRDAWREAGETVAFTNGCYDLLHAGHVTSIAFAREQGDRLILAVNSDDSVRANKGDKRPIVPAVERALLLASLESVDVVHVFDTKEVTPLIEQVRPDVLVKGGDTAKVLGQEFIESYGGRVVRTPIFKDLSTTDVIARILELHPEFHADVIIIGGGIAGLWTLNRLRAAGYHALLIERDALGAGQTLASQGVLHGGIKYTLQGKLTDASETIRAMPERWAASLANRNGAGEVNLSRVPVLSDQQVLWSSRSLGSRLASFFGSRMLQSRVEPIADADRPEVFRSPDFKGALYWIRETVIDVQQLVKALAAPHQDHLVHGDPNLLSDQEVDLNGQRLRARRIVLAAGAGNQALLDQLGQPSPAMQRRPLHQVMIRKPGLPPFFSVCLGATAKPRLVSTTHDDIWYLGGDLAETGVHRSEAEQIAFATSELAELLPWIDLRDADWSTLRIDRAEPATKDGSRPSGVHCETVGNLLVTWPSKLVLAPLLADAVLESVPESANDYLPLPAFSPPPLGDFPWSTT